MRTVLSNEYSLHNPRWKYVLGTEVYETRDTPMRVEVIRRALEADERFQLLEARRFPEARLAELHPYHEFIKRTAQSLTDPTAEIYPDLFPGEGAGLPKRLSPLWGGLYCTDAVTPLMMRTYDVARGSAEAAMTAADLVARGEDREVYALCRPSGHHAGPRVFGGYCYFNNAALAAERLVREGPTAILDIDYHHGNGTQEFFWRRGDVLVVNVHADPEVEYPYFWGYVEERGEGEGEDATLNLPLPHRTDDDTYREAIATAAGAIRDFGARTLVVSAGFDTHAEDPIGGFSLTTDVYPAIGRALGALGLPTVIVQEGGYNTDVLPHCVHGFLTGFLAGRADQSQPG